MNRSLNIDGDRFGNVQTNSTDMSIHLGDGELRDGPLILLYLVNPRSTQNDVVGGTPVFAESVTDPVATWGVCMPQVDDGENGTRVARGA